MKQGFAQLALIALILLLISSGLAVFLTTKNESPQKPTPSPLPQYQTEETISTDEGSANWKTYRNLKLRVELKHPENYQVYEESENKIMISKDRLGSGGFWIMNKNNSGYVNFAALKTCKEVSELLKENLGERPTCLDDGKNFGQDQDIANIKLGGTDAASFYSTSTGQGGTFRIVQTIKEPFIEFYFFSDSVSNKKFQDQILSTFKFTQ